MVGHGTNTLGTPQRQPAVPFLLSSSPYLLRKLRACSIFGGPADRVKLLVYAMSGGYQTLASQSPEFDLPPPVMTLMGHSCGLRLDC